MRKMDDAALDFELLRVLDVMHRERHVTNAALSVGLSQPAMSRAIQRLRVVFGDELFVRTARGMLPTPRADELAPAARRILESAEALRRPAAFDPARLERTFVIGSADHLDTELLPAIANTFATAPGVTFVMRPLDAHASEQLASGAMDLAVGLRTSMPSDAIVRHLYHEHFACAVRRGHPRVKRSLSLATFCELQHLQIAPRGDGSSVVDQALAARGLKRRIAVRTHTFQSAPLVVARSNLVITAPRRVLEPVAKILRLALFPPPLAIPPFEIVQAWHPRVQRDPSHAWFRDLVAATVRPSARP